MQEKGMVGAVKKISIIINIALIGLVGCQKQISDGAPSAYVVQQAVIKKVVPKAEPPSKYGNPDKYEVMGKTYHVMHSAKAFKQHGLASWYGTKFHQRRTSSGEPYDMFAMTAAHKTLPLPTYLKVTNTDNDKEIIVKVNDRGPFHEDRIIDLSYAAAKQLGILQNGTGHVEIEAINFEQQSEEPRDQLYLQLGAFRQYDKAESYKGFIQGLMARATTAVENKKDMFNVIMGPFKSRENRQQTKQFLLAHGIEGVFSFMR